MTPELLTNGFIKITSLIKHAHHIKHLVMITESGALLKLNARIVSLIKVVGLNKELRFTQLINLEMSKVNKT